MQTLHLSDGRHLDYAVAGPEGAPVLLIHHGTPGSGIIQRTLVRIAAECGLQTLFYSRAGAGGSSRLAGRSVSDVVPDLVELFDHLGVERCVTTGWSGGGPHSLALGALAPHRIAGVLCVAGVAPYDAEGLDFLAGMGQENVEEFTAAVAGESALRELLDPAAQQLREIDAAGMLENSASQMPPVDRVQLDDEFGEDMAASFREAVRLGHDGWVDDDLALVKDWGFDVGDIEVPTIVLQGAQDLMVPFSHGEWLAAHIPGAKSHLLPGEGHLSVTSALPWAFADLRATLTC